MEPTEVARGHDRLANLLHSLAAGTVERPKQPRPPREVRDERMDLAELTAFLQAPSQTAVRSRLKRIRALIRDGVLRKGEARALQPCRTHPMLFRRSDVERFLDPDGRKS